MTTYEQAPGAEFDSWIAEFRIRFARQLDSILSRSGYRSMAGRTEMIFSISKNHRLRGRILRSTAAPQLTDCLLATTRVMDGSSILDFPHSSNLDGFNFSMSWLYPEQPWSNVSGTLAGNNLRGQINPQGARAITGALPATSMNLNSKDASGKLMGKNLGQNIGLDGTSISTDVAGMLVPKKKPVELKAQPAKKLEETK